MTVAPHGQVALVTGASSGIGRAIAEALQDKGFRVLGTSRNPDRIAPELRVAGVTYLALDLLDPASITACAVAAGPVDVLVNNAGESQVGPFEEVPADELEHHFRLNVFGQLRLTQQLLPGMRERGHGRIVMIGSMQASFPMAFRSAYSASKAALKGFALAMRPELWPYGVWVTTIEPGAISSGISERRTRFGDASSPYAADLRTVSTRLDANEAAGTPVEDVAALVVRAVLAERPGPVYAIGSRAPLVFALQRALPRATVEKVIARSFGLKR